MSEPKSARTTSTANLQSFLSGVRINGKPLYAGELDGEMNSATIAATKQLQKELHLPETGIYDDVTRKAWTELPENERAAYRNGVSVSTTGGASFVPPKAPSQSAPEAVVPAPQPIAAAAPALRPTPAATAPIAPQVAPAAPRPAVQSIGWWRNYAIEQQQNHIREHGLDPKLASPYDRPATLTPNSSASSVDVAVANRKPGEKMGVYAPVGGMIGTLDRDPEVTLQAGQKDVYERNKGPEGRVIGIYGDDGKFHQLANLDEIAPGVKLGARVERGDRLADDGLSGRSAEPHVSWRITPPSKPNPVRPEDFARTPANRDQSDLSAQLRGSDVLTSDNQLAANAQAGGRVAAAAPAPQPVVLTTVSFDPSAPQQPATGPNGGYVSADTPAAQPAPAVRTRTN